MRVTFYTCARGDTRCLTRLGSRAVPLRTVAVGDPGLLGRWLYVPPLGGLVRADDTGPALGSASLDVFVGGFAKDRDARRLGVKHWRVQECRARLEPVLADRPLLLLGPSGGPAALGARLASRLRPAA
jgi:3D (Asp-Asp-Asp) domain-containing protein